MAAWNAQDGLFHFLFANEDRYVLDSLVCLNLTDYLRHALSEKRYERILFVGRLQDSFVLRIFRQDVWQWCIDRIKGVFGLGLKSGQFWQADPSGCRLFCTPEQVRKLISMAEQTAFVFELNAFALLYRARESEVQQLKQENAFRKNLMILHAGLMAEESLPLLKDANGIFRGSAVGGLLFPEISDVFLDTDPEDCGFYLLLRRRIGDRCVFLNQLTRGAIRRLIRRTVLVERDDVEVPEAAQENRLVEFVWRWHHDADLQNQLSGLFSDNPTNSYAVLGKDLVRYWKLIEEAAEKSDLRAPVVHPVDEQNVISGGMLLRHLPETKYMWQDDPNRHRAYHAAASRIRRTLQKPRIYEPEGQAEEYLRQFLERLGIAVKKGDSATIGRIESCICEVVRQKFAFDEKGKQQWEYCDNLIIESARQFEVEKSIRLDEYRVSQLRSQRTAVVAQIEQIVPGDSDSERGYLQGRVLSIHREIETYQKLIDRKRADLLKLQERISRLEQAGELLRHRHSLRDEERVEELLRDLTSEIGKTAANLEMSAEGFAAEEQKHDSSLWAEETDEEMIPRAGVGWKLKQRR